MAMYFSFYSGDTFSSEDEVNLTKYNYIWFEMINECRQLAFVLHIELSL